MRALAFLLLCISQLFASLPSYADGREGDRCCAEAPSVTDISSAPCSDDATCAAQTPSGEKCGEQCQEKGACCSNASLLVPVLSSADLIIRSSLSYLVDFSHPQDLSDLNLSSRDKPPRA